MDHRELWAGEADGGIHVPKITERSRFSASAKEIGGALIAYGLGYLYMRMLFWTGTYRAEDFWIFKLMLAVFTLGFLGLTEWLHRGLPRSRESWIWLGCTGLCLVSILLDRCRMWQSPFYTFLLLHGFAVWWVLSRSGRLAEGKSGSLLPLDALWAFVVIPFKHFFLRVRCLFYGLTLLGQRRKMRGETLLWVLLAVAAAALLFYFSANLLTAADTGFASLLTGFTSWLRIEWDVEFVIRSFLALPVAAYVFGLVAGSAREDAEALQARGARLRFALGKLRKVPEPLWLGLTAVFVLFYLVFFGVQARYLFGAFTRTLPEGFIVSQYAREGFFELCKVMAVNFVLLWLVTRSARRAAAESRPLRVLCLLLLAESLLFAVIAFSKLALYISCFGFTPLRLQSTWLVCVLAAGCVAAALGLYGKKGVFRAWLFFGGVSLALLQLW